MMRKPKFKSTAPTGAMSTPAKPASAPAMPNEMIESRPTGTAHSCAVSRSAATARTWRPNCVLLNNITIAATVTRVTMRMTRRCHGMTAPSSSNVPFTIGLRPFGLVPCQTPMSAMTISEIPNVAITTTWIDRPRSDATPHSVTTWSTVFLSVVTTSPALSWDTTFEMVSSLTVECSATNA